MAYTSRGAAGLLTTELPVSYTGHIELAAVPSAVRHARHWAADELARSDPAPCQDLIDTAVLVISELVTNAIQAVGSMPSQARNADQAQLSLLIKRERSIVRIEVHDSARGPVLPAFDRGASAETGRGLMVLAALSLRWGCLPCPRGKVVWCELSD